MKFITKSDLKNKYSCYLTTLYCTISSLQSSNCAHYQTTGSGEVSDFEKSNIIHRVRLDVVRNYK